MVDPRLDSSQAPTLPTGVDDPGQLEGPTLPNDRGDVEHEPPLRAGESIGRFTVIGVLGEGGMGVVYSARDPELGRELAVKVLHRSVDEADERARIRLLREAQAMARVSHPNLVTIYDVGDSNGRVFIAMEKITGRTLGRWQQGSPRQWRELVQMYREAGEGLLAAHEEGLVHRDFKPGNVLISDRGRVQVVDFGLARAVTSEDMSPIEPDLARSGQPEQSDGRALALDLTRTGAMVGTPAYMAPEQFQGQPTDPRTDQFSFCVALWEALFDERPFEGTTPVAVMFSVIEGRRRPAPTNADVPPAIVEALERGLSTAPSARFESMQPLLAVLDAAIAPNQPASTTQWPRWLGGLGALGAGAALVWTLGRPEPEPTPSTDPTVQVDVPEVGLAALDGYTTRKNFRSTATLWHTAQRDFARACEAEPDRARWCAAERFCAGQAALEEHRFSDAEARMLEAIERDGAWPLPQIGLAGALRHQGRLEAALEASITAQGLDPASWVAVSSAAATHVAADRLDDAIDEYLRALELSPDHPDVMADLALVYHARRLDSQAERYALAALARDPESMPALMLLAERALEDADGEAALAHADRAVAVGSQSVTAWLARGDALLLLGREDDARQSLERAVSLLEVDPDHGAPSGRLAAVQEALAAGALPMPRYHEGAVGDERSRAAEEAAEPEDEAPPLEPERSKNATPSRRAKKRSKKATSGAKPKGAAQDPPGL